MIILGIDPGPTTHGLAWLDQVPNGWQATCRPVTWPHKDVVGVSWVSDVNWGVTSLVSIEVPEQVHPSRTMTKGAAIARGTALIRTMERVADIRVACERAGVPVVTMTCREARRAMGVRGKQPDQATALVLSRLVQGWPKKSNKHVRDAAIVALAGWEKWRREGGK